MWGQQVVVDNKPGAGGNIASEFVARSAPMANTLYITAGGLAVIASCFRRSNYDPVVDFAPVTLICLFPNLLLVRTPRPSLGWGSARACAGQIGKSHLRVAGHGSSPHMSAELFKYMAKVEMVHVPYRGRGPGRDRPDRGRVDCTFAVMASGLRLVQNGQLRALGVSTASRQPTAADVPTSRRPACPATTPPRGSRSSCQPRRRPRSSGKYKPTPLR